MKACINLIVSSTDLPTGASFIVIDLIILYSLIINKPLKAAPLRSSDPSSTKTPNYLDISFDTSATKGKLILPNPPSFLGNFVHARCVKALSIDIPIT